MSAKTATIVSFEEYRQRRAQARAAAASSTPPAVMWYPVWVMVPVWPLQQSAAAAQSLVSG